MKRWIAMGFLVALAVGAHAAPPTPESVERMLAASRAEALLDGMRPQLHSTMLAAATQASQGKPVTPEEQKVFLKFMESSSAVIAEETAMAKLKPMFMEIYTTHFSQEEVDGITAFYESPVGQSLLSKQPGNQGPARRDQTGGPRRRRQVAIKIEAAPALSMSSNADLA